MQRSIPASSALPFRYSAASARSSAGGCAGARGPPPRGRLGSCRLPAMTAIQPMPLQSKLVSRRDLAFVLYELLGIAGLAKRARYADHTRETFDAAIDIAAKIAEERFATHNKKVDQNEPTFDGNRVLIIPEVKAAP